jgi:phosphomannomutase
VAYLKARIALGRDMRLSSPSLAAAFIDGATPQGADVVGLRHDPDRYAYFAVARPSRRRREITASHNPASTTA